MAGTDWIGRQIEKKNFHKKFTKTYVVTRSTWLGVESLVFHGNENAVYFSITSYEGMQR